MNMILLLIIMGNDGNVSSARYVSTQYFRLLIYLFFCFLFGRVFSCFLSWMFIRQWTCCQVSSVDAAGTVLIVFYVKKQFF